MRIPAPGLVLGALLLFAVFPAEAQLSACRLIDVTAVRFSPDMQTYNVGDLVTVRATMDNLDKEDYNFTIFSVLNNPQWSTSADGTPCGPHPQPTTSSCAFDSKILADPTGKAPVLIVRKRDISISTGTGNNTSTVATKGDMPRSLVIQVTGEVPPISIQEERSFLRIRQERGGTELCTVVAETRAITSAVLGRIESCFQEADAALAKSRRFMDRDARDAGLRSADLASEQDLLDQAEKNLKRAKDDYAKLRAGTENQSILDNCNDAIKLAQRVEGNLKEKVGGAGFGSFISGTVVPAIVVVAVIIVALKFLGRKRWDRL
ncbi:MAG: hypothetical protein QXO51_02240 [Halobacteria archaeon]